MRIRTIFLCLMLMLAVEAQAAVSARMPDTAALLRENGEEVIPAGIYQDIVPLGTDRFAAGDAAGYALLDAEGRPLSEAIYARLQPANDLLIAQRNGLYGLLDDQGREMSDFIYTWILPAEGGSFWALKGDPDDLESDEIFILEADGGESASGQHARRMGQAGEGRIAVQTSEGGLWGYCDARGRLAIPAEFAYAGKFIAGRAAVVQNDHYGVIDAQGAWIVPAEYDSLEISESGFILTAKNAQGVWILDLDGREICAYAGEENFGMLLGDGYGVVEGAVLHICDAAGNNYADVDWYAAVSEGLNGQLIVSEGAWGEACVYLLGDAGRYQNLYPLGMAEETALYACMQVHAVQYASDLLGEIQTAVDLETARYGVIDGAGVERIPCEYESIEYLGEDRLLLYADGLWQMSDANGEILWENGVKQTSESTSEEGF